MSKCFGILGAFMSAFGAAFTLVAAPPQIAHVSPLALAPGQTAELTIRGQNLQNPTRLWTTFATRCEFVAGSDESSQKGETLVCRVTVPREEQVGIGAMRIVTAEGVSNPVLVMLDDLATLAETPDNHTTQQAQSIPWPIAVDGQCDPVQEDLFRFHAAAEQRLSFEVVAQRLGTKLDPMVRIVSADGTEQVRLDDAEGSGGDTRFAHTFELEGDYLLSLRDVRHAGGIEFRYRLRVGSFPLITSVYPAGGRTGGVMSFELLGKNGEALSPLNVLLPQLANTPRLVSFSVPTGINMGSGWFQVEANAGSESLEQEPNDSFAEATPADFPGALNGRLDKPGDRDHFKFHAKKGQLMHAVAKTRELGSSCDIHMSLLKADGSQIAQARQDRETILDADIPDDGKYLLQVEDLLVGRSSGHVYRIDLSNRYGGFSLAAEQSQYTSPQGGTFVAKILAQRRGYSGPIGLAVEGLGDGVKLEGNTFEGAETLLKVSLPNNVAKGEVRLATIVGTAKVGEQTVTVRANQRDQLMTTFPNALSFPTALENAIAIGVGPPFPPYFELSLDGNELYFPQLVGASTFDVNIARKSDAFTEPVSLAIEGLPQGITAEVAPVDGGLKAVRVSLKGPSDLPEQDVSVRIVGTAKFQEQSRTVAIENLKLRVTKPLVIMVTMLGPIVAGGQQEADVQVRRFGGEPQPIRLQVSDGPPSLSAPIFVTIPSDANQLKLPLSAATTAPLGKFDNLVVVASTTVQGQNVTVQSRPASVEIQPAPTE